eukprot:gene2044-biopygen15469
MDHSRGSRQRRFPVRWDVTKVGRPGFRAIPLARALGKYFFVQCVRQSAVSAEGCPPPSPPHGGGAALRAENTALREELRRVAEALFGRQVQCVWN